MNIIDRGLVLGLKQSKGKLAFSMLSPPHAMLAHSNTESLRVGDIHKALGHPLCIRESITIYQFWLVH